MIRNAYLGLESFYIGPLRNEMCIQAIWRTRFWICIYFRYVLRMHIYVHMCTKLVILIIMINTALRLWIRTWYLFHLINILDLIYIYVCSNARPSWHWCSMCLYMYMYICICIYIPVYICRCLWMRTWRWYLFQRTIYFRILYIVFVDFTELLYSILVRYFVLPDAQYVVFRWGGRPL